MDSHQQNGHTPQQEHHFFYFEWNGASLRTFIDPETSIPCVQVLSSDGSNQWIVPQQQQYQQPQQQQTIHSLKRSRENEIENHIMMDRQYKKRRIEVDYQDLAVEVIQKIFSYLPFLSVTDQVLNNFTFGSYFGKYRDGTIQLTMYNNIAIEMPINLNNSDFQLLLRYAMHVIIAGDDLNLYKRMLTNLNKCAPYMIELDVDTSISDQSTFEFLTGTPIICKRLNSIEITLHSISFDSFTKIQNFSFLKQLCLECKQVPSVQISEYFSTIFRLKALITLRVLGLGISKQALYDFFKNCPFQRIELSELRVDGGVDIYFDGLQHNTSIQTLMITGSPEAAVDAYRVSRQEIARLRNNKTLRAFQIIIGTDGSDLFSALAEYSSIKRLKIDSTELLDLTNLDRMRSLEKLILHLGTYSIKSLLNLIDKLNIAKVVLWSLDDDEQIAEELIEMLNAVNSKYRTEFEFENQCYDCN